MNDLTSERVRALLSPYVAGPLPEETVQGVLRYLAVFTVWSKRTNLTTITAQAQVVQRHFGEGFALAEALPAFTTALDLGSGAGFPGIPLALARPGAQVTLAESQGKKAAFLREAVSAMSLRTTVWAQRAEALPAGSCFDVVALRAVDNMVAALQMGCGLVKRGGTLAFYAGEHDAIEVPEGDWECIQRQTIPYSSGQLVLARRTP